LIFTAAKEDLPVVIKMALTIPKEHGFENLPKVDLAKTTEFFYDKWSESPLFIFKEEGKIKGFVGTQIVTTWWSSTPVISDYIFFVDPEHRKGGKVFKALAGAMKDFSKLNKLPVIMTFMSNDRTPAKERLFEKQGFKKSGFLLTFGI